MTVGIVLAAAAALAALASAAGSWLCWRELRKGPAPGGSQAAQESGEDEELREGILNLLRYAPAGNSREEEA